jgi:hypothetical protein
MRVTSTAAARRLVRARGGTLYVTRGGESGAAAISTEPPAAPVDTDGFDGGGYLLVLDRRLERPRELQVGVVEGELAIHLAP